MTTITNFRCSVFVTINNNHRRYIVGVIVDFSNERDARYLGHVIYFYQKRKYPEKSSRSEYLFDTNPKYYPETIPRRIL